MAFIKSQKRKITNFRIQLFPTQAFLQWTVCEKQGPFATYCPSLQFVSVSYNIKFYLYYVHLFRMMPDSFQKRFFFLIIIANVYLVVTFAKLRAHTVHVDCRT